MNMKLILASTACTLLALTAAPVAANHHKKESTQANDGLRSVIDHERRANDKARDKYRRPAQTIKFFDVQPHHTVMEYAPGGGWYTRVLAPYVAEHGKYLAVNRAPTRPSSDGGAPWTERFPGQVEEMTGVPATKVAAYYGNAIAKEAHGTVDRILIIRMIHNLLRGNAADSEIKAMRAMLKDDGMVGIVQHLAPDDAPYSYTDGSKGYLHKADVIAMMALYGFDLVKESDHNANSKDTADYPGGVWTLPPVRRFEKEDDAKYNAIGESTRMTLLFKKAS